ncbi:MAG: acetylornithine deacetylase/succinyl-diaminopimelate desuccinylase family protein [bacterium]|jgi:acetylornithine deacetylase/succinyl-diaminopimelate desuccinylase family protein
MTFDPVSITQQLVQIPSESSNPIGTYPSGYFGEEELVTYIQDFAQKLGIESRIEEVFPHRPNLYLRFPNLSKPKLLFGNHLDTVSAAHMEVAPFLAEIKDGKLWGRGSCDVKGSAGALLSALGNLTKQKKELNYDITLAFTVDEECSFSGAKVAKKRLDDFDFGIITEPTNFQIVTSHKGVYRFRINAKGIAAHSSTPELGENAIYKLAPVIQDIQKIALQIQNVSDPILGTNTLSANCVHGGVAFNIIPDQCSLECDLRFLPDYPILELEKEIQELCDRRGVQLEILLNAKGFRNLNNNPLETSFIQANQKILGTEPSKIGVSFATDCSELADKGDCIVWGPGEIQYAHTKNEHILIDDLYRAEQVLIEFLAPK